MLSFESDIELPSKKLFGLKLKGCYFFDYDCFEFTENEVFFTDPADFIQVSECIILRLRDLGLVECYSVDSRIEDSECFKYSYLFSFKKEELDSDIFLSDVLKVEYSYLFDKLDKINGK